MKRQPVFFGTLAVVLSLIATPRAHAQNGTPVNPSTFTTGHIGSEPAGLSLLSPYIPGKIPVVFIHGLWSNPSSWRTMILAMEQDPAIKGRFQLWTFGYATGDPIPYSAYLLRKDLEVVRRRFDPEKSDKAFDRMVLVGHSMGGLLAKMMATDAGDRLWRVISERPFGELLGAQDDIELFRNGLFFAAKPEVRRVIFIATPHRGSHFDRGRIQRLGTRLVRVADPLQAAHRRLVASNDPTFFRGHFGKAIPTSIDELEWASPILTGLFALSTVPTVNAHSIIAVRQDSPPNDRTDGLVQYASAHIEGVDSEKVVMSGHFCQGHPEVIAEVRRILAEHASL